MAMDQPQTSGDAKLWDWLITGFVGLAGIIGGWLTTRTKARADVESKSVEAGPSIISAGIELSEGIVSNWRDEIAQIRRETRDEIAKERERADEERTKREDWQERAMRCETRVPFLEAQLEALKMRVAELEKQVERYQEEARGQRADC